VLVALSLLVARGAAGQSGDPEDDPAGATERPQTIGAAVRPEGGGGLRKACAGDIEKLCANVERSREAIRGCLQANAAKLSESCRLAAGRQGKGGGAGAREADARKPDGSTPQ